LIKTGDMLTFPVPTATYSKLFLFFNGAAGGTNITVTLTYADGMEMQPAFIPDYYDGVKTTNAVTFDLVADLAKWDKNTVINEGGHHTITGAEFHPMAGKMLTGVTVTKDAMGNLVFWGATGIATSDVAIGGAGSAAGAAGAAGVAGAAGMGGAPGAGGTGGVTGSGAGGVVSPAAGAAGTSSGTSAGSGTAGSATGPGGTAPITPLCRAATLVAAAASADTARVQRAARFGCCWARQRLAAAAQTPRVVRLASSALTCPARASAR